MCLQFVELFSGAGLLGHAFSEAGFKPILAIDNNNDAVSTYNSNSVAPIARVHDVCKPVTAKSDLLVAGPPCQGFSSLGSRNENDARNKLSLEILKWVIACDPSVIVIENVPQFVRSKYKKKIDVALLDLGFDGTEWILNASSFGAAQNRIRAFSVYSKRGLPLQPSSSSSQISVLEAFEENPPLDGDPLHFMPPTTPLAAERIKNIPKNGGKMDLIRLRPDLCPPSWMHLGAQAVDVWGRMDESKPSNTIRCQFQNPSKGRYIHPTLDRVITLREGARLQGVPDQWKFTGVRTSVSRQIGNGVPIPLGRKVAEAVMSVF